jgi:hypothetical protein
MAKLAIDQIEATAGTQVRVKIDTKIVDEYAEAIESGQIFPPLTVFAPKNSQRYILADGFHRLAAAVKLGRKVIGVDVKEGGVHEALHFALSANSAHGIRRSNDDKRNAVMLAFKDPNYDEWSLRQLSELCCVSHMLVRDMKAEQNESESGKAVSSYSNGKVTPRERKQAPTQDQTDRKELSGALATIKSFPYDGTKAYGRLELVSLNDELAFAFDWISEALDEHKAQEDGPDE